MFWAGLIIGLFIGANLAFLSFFLFACKKGYDACKTYYSEFDGALIRCL